MSTETTRITITRANLPRVIAKAYDLSRPQGLGFLHATPGPIPHAEMQQILDRSDGAQFDMNRGAYLDYVVGRAVKLGIPFDAETGTYYMTDNGRGWYDHTDEQWAELVEFTKELQA